MKRFIKLLLFDNRVLLFSYYLLYCWWGWSKIKGKNNKTDHHLNWNINESKITDDHYVHNFPKLWNIDWLNITWETHVDLILIKTSLHAKQAQRSTTTCWWAWNTCIKIMNQNLSCFDKSSTTSSYHVQIKSLGPMVGMSFLFVCKNTVNSSYMITCLMITF